VPLTQLPLQQSAFVEHCPPMGAQVMPDGTHVPFWQRPPPQQSESAVQVPLPIAMHEAAHWSAPPAAGFGTQTWLQQLSHSEHAWPAG
jgi:hypothetical protein